MLSGLHFHTVLLNMLVICTVCSVVIALILQKRRRHYQGLGRISALFGMHALGLALLVSGPILNPFWSSFIGIACIAGGFWIGLNGLECFVGRQRPQYASAIAFSIFLVLQAYWLFVHPETNLRSLNLTWIAIFYSLRSGHQLLTPLHREMIHYTRYCGIIFLLFSGILLIRFYFILSRWDLPPVYLESGGFEPVFFMIFQITYVLITFFLLVMVNKRLLEDKEKALSEVRILTGMLPICASCKNIRDDQGYWKQIEDYLHTHSEASFSHSICPNCAKKLYPDLYEEIQRDANRGESSPKTSASEPR